MRGGHARQVIRQYHGHLSGIYSLALHPTLDVLVTGGRDSVARVWDMRTKVQVWLQTHLPLPDCLAPGGCMLPRGQEHQLFPEGLPCISCRSVH